MAKEKDFSLPIFSEAYGQYGQKLEEGAMVVIEGVASQRDGENRIAANVVLSVDEALVKYVEEVTWLIDPDHKDAESCVEEMFDLADKGLGNTLVRIAFARKEDKDGLVAETDSRFKMRMSFKTFQSFRTRGSVRGARVKFLKPNFVLEKKFG